MSNRAFGDTDFIDASRQFVCVRPDSYEDAETQQKIRELLGGTMQNTAFCLFAPDGNKQLSRSGRGLTSDVRGAQGLDIFALQYPTKGDPSEAITPDFNSFRMSLNVASADTRVLVVVVAPKEQMDKAEKSMRAVAWHDDIVGRFHFDFETDASQLTKPLSLDSVAQPGIYVISPGTFGVDGKVISQLPLDSSDQERVAALKNANEQFAKTAERKVYASHVSAGHSAGYFFDMAMPMGEDRDGDGEPDSSSSRRYDSAKRRSLNSGKYFPAETK